MLRWYTVVLGAFFLFCGSVQAENWLLKESSSQGFYAVLPVRVGPEAIGGFEIRDLELYRDGSRITGYGFTVKKDGQSFDFDRSAIPRYYLRPSGNTFTAYEETTSWPCDRDFFTAVVQDQEQRVTKNYSGLVSYYPKGTSFQTKYVSVTEVLGKQKIQEKMRPVEVWGLANSRENAQKMVDYFNGQLVKSTYHYFSAAHRDFTGQNRLLADQVRVEFTTRSEETQSDKGNILTGVKYRKADFFMDLAVNGFRANWEAEAREGRRRVRSGSYSGLKWFWSNPGWHAETLDGRYVKAYVRSEGKNSDIWVQYKGSSSKYDMDIVNVRIPKCE